MRKPTIHELNDLPSGRVLARDGKIKTMVIEPLTHNRCLTCGEVPYLGKIIRTVKTSQTLENDCPSCYIMKFGKPQDLITFAKRYFFERGHVPTECHKEIIRNVQRGDRYVLSYPKGGRVILQKMFRAYKALTMSNA